MEPTKSGKLYLAALGFVVCLAFTGDGVFATTRKEKLTKQLTVIRADGRVRHVDPCTLEVRFVDLIQDYNTPSEQGMIYAAAAFSYCEQGFGRGGERETRIAKTIEYASKALENPLDVSTNCRLRGYLSDALIVRSKRRPTNERTEALRAATIICLEGLKLALDNNAPKEMPTPPTSLVYNVLTPDKDAQEKLRQKREERAAAFEKYRQLRELWKQRQALTLLCIDRCSDKPDAIEQFRATATRILDGHEEAVNDIVRQIEARAARRQRSHTNSSGGAVGPDTRKARKDQ